ncbi:unnamed protein product [marine sediment metagenome]|uniref:Peptidase C1A papain C-terminal domain-containing protein n=1 Tax=marine sediment metagenome TaxID=412755 RepID=X1QIX2_9ZZZZ
MPLKKELGLLRDPPKVEAVKLYTLYYSPSQIEEYRRQIRLGRPRQKIMLVKYELPTSFSWQEKMSPIRDQGEVGSCACMAATALVEFLYPDVANLSEAWLYEITNNICFCFNCNKVYNQEDFLVNGIPQKCEDIICPICGKPAERVCDCGRYFYMVIKQLGGEGLALGPGEFGEPVEECRYYGNICAGEPPDTYGTTNLGWCSDWKAKARAHKISYETPEITVNNLKHAIHQAPICIGMNVYSNFYSYASGIYDKEEGDYAGGHGVALVGWNDTDRYFILRNSWGTNWGINGYCYYSYDLIKSLFDTYLLKKVVPKYVCDTLWVKRKE